jgi:hypothetical protein
MIISAKGKGAEMEKSAQHFVTSAVDARTTIKKY